MASPVPNGSYLQQADPQTFPTNATGTAPQNYQAQPGAPQQEQSSSADVPKDEVGWYFVEQYYTTLNKTPERLHLFYNKKSTMVWGTEGESLPLAHGRSQICDKIAAHEFKDCKVRVSNVDSQASGTGIVIQVLGEMSNNGLPNRKFAQCFFLADQPNGYFVLNDIFRYLKDDDDIEEGEDYHYSEEAVAEAVEAAAEAVEEIKEEIAAELEDMTIKETSTVEVETAEGDKIKVEETVTFENTSAPEAKEPEEPVPAAESVEVASAPEPVEPEPQAATETPAPVAAEPVEEPAAAAPVVEEKAPAPAPVKMTPPPAPASAPAPKPTWANLVASSAKPAAATPAATPAAKPVIAAPATPTQAAAPAAATAATPATPTTPSGGSQWQTADSKRHSRVNTTAAGQTLAYVKNVTDAVTDKALREALTKFGNLKQFEVNRARNCAFIEFETSSAFSAANSANPHMIGGSNVLVEERRRAANGSYGRGGISGRGDGRPASQGRAGFQPRDSQRFDGGRGRGGRGGLGARGGSKTAASGN